MKKVSYKDLERTGNPHGIDARKLFGNEHVQVVHIELKPGESLKRHSTAVDVFFYVLEGDGIIEVGEERIPAGKDILVESPKMIPHCLYNESDSNFRVLVVKTPSPNAEQTKKTVEGMSFLNKKA